MTAWPPPSCHSDPMRQQLLREARMSPSLSHPPHKNRSPVRAGPCLPAAQAPTRIRHIETWAGRPATGDISREGISDPGARIPNLASGVNGRCSFPKLCMTITWIQKDLRNSWGGENQISDKGSRIRMAWKFPTILNARTQWRKVFSILKENFNLAFCIPTNFR